MIHSSSHVPSLLLHDKKSGSKDTGFEIHKTWGYFLHFSRSTVQSFVWISSETTVVQLEYLNTLKSLIYIVKVAFFI